MVAYSSNGGLGVFNSVNALSMITVCSGHTANLVRWRLCIKITSFDILLSLFDLAYAVFIPICHLNGSAKWPEPTIFE